MIAVIKCPKCGGEVQATRKLYYTWSNGHGQWHQAPQGEDWDVYCENDHGLGGMDGRPTRDDLARLQEVKPS